VIRHTPKNVFTNRELKTVFRILSTVTLGRCGATWPCTVRQVPIFDWQSQCAAQLVERRCDFCRSINGRMLDLLNILSVKLTPWEGGTIAYRRGTIWNARRSRRSRCNSR